VIDDAGLKHPLGLHPVWTKQANRDWSYEVGLRQLCLDLFLDHFAEAPTLDELWAKENGTLAWITHLAYTPVLAEQLIPPQDGDWVVTSQQLQDWVDDWSVATHLRFAQERYGASYPGDHYIAWVSVLEHTLAQNGALSLEAIGITPVKSWKLYLAGYSPPHVAYLRACERIAELQGVVAETTIDIHKVWDIPPDF
jgi:hypothetical protein